MTFDEIGDIGDFLYGERDPLFLSEFDLTDLSTLDPLKPDPVQEEQKQKPDLQVSKIGIDTLQSSKIVARDRHRTTFCLDNLKRIDVLRFTPPPPDFSSPPIWKVNEDYLMRYAGKWIMRTGRLVHDKKDAGKLLTRKGSYYPDWSRVQEALLAVDPEATTEKSKKHYITAWRHVSKYILNLRPQEQAPDRKITQELKTEPVVKQELQLIEELAVVKEKYFPPALAESDRPPLIPISSPMEIKISPPLMPRPAMISTESDITILTSRLNGAEQRIQLLEAEVMRLSRIVAHLLKRV